MKLINFHLRHHELNTCLEQNTNSSSVYVKYAVNIRHSFTAMWNLVLSLKGDRLSVRKKGNYVR
jgi:hypothetical protein